MHPFLAPTRRTLLAEIGLLIGASALPALALAVPKKTAKRFLAAPQYATLLALADTILPATDTPGALAAQVPARIDAMLAKWASAATRSNVLGALDRVETAAKAQKGKNFSALNAAERAELLKPYDAAALKSAPPPVGAAKANLFSAATYVTDQGYFQIKSLVLDLYYFSEVGSANELAYVHVPGKFQPSIKLTPQSRPELGTGPF
ncbi:MAG: hypothetical protein RLY97_1746 [Pseudomonadota bacterium]